MKHFTFNFRKRFFNLALMMGAVLLSFGVWAQPTVNVPTGTNGCVVVVEGTGGNFTSNIVGNGGVITMPDPDGGGTFSINVPTGYVIDGWTLYGDISIDDISITDPYDEAVQNVASGITSADIITYNKKLRTPSESPPELARSKGQVRIEYTNVSNSCPGVLTFDIYKTYSNNIPDIIGESCWIPDIYYTYSVDQIASDNLNDDIGVDNYYWSVIDNEDNEITNFYTSADESSITLQAPSTLESPYTIKVCFGRANDWDGNDGGTHTTCKTKIVGAEPEKPTIDTKCVATSDSEFTASIIDPDPSYTYTWTSSNGEWTPASQEGTSATFETLGYGSATVYISVDGCSQSQFEYPIGRYLENPTNIISGADDCLEAGSDYTFSITNASQLEITWDIPSGWSINTGSPTNGNQSTISLHVPDTVTNGASYTLYAWSCDEEEMISKTIYIQPSSPSINSPASSNVCISKGDDTPLVFTASPAGSYVWQVPTGWIITSSSNTESITVTPDGDNFGTVTATRIVGDNCMSASSATWEVNFTAIQPDAILPVTCWSFGTGEPIDITVNNAPSPFYGTYTVSSSPSGFIDSYDVDEITGVITLTPEINAPADTYVLTITHVVSGCSSQSNTNIPVNYKPKGNLPVPPQIALDDQFASYGFDGYLLNGVLPNTNIIDWYIDDEPQGEPGLSFYILQDDYDLPATVCVEFVVSGCTSRVCINVIEYQSLIINNGNTSKTPSHSLKIDGLKVYPNPNNGSFSIEIPNIKENANVEIYDMNGKLSHSSQLHQGKNTIDERDLSSGTYLLLFTIDDEKSAQKIIVRK